MSTPAQLRELRARLAQVAEGEARDPRVERLLDLLDRDLLPRTAGGHGHLVAGIVGPNNAGKSALFNSLVAGPLELGSPAPRRLSPSLPTGGATRRLVGALSGVLRQILVDEPALSRFPMRAVTPPSDDGLVVATETPAAEDVAEMLLIETETLPESLLLVDTPDFDSVLVENRLVTDALLAVCDVAIVVVTRHTYQNHDVIQFLRGWLGEGRPWVLVYNESIDEATTLEHARKIEADLEGSAEAIFAAPFDVGIARGEAALVPLLLQAADAGAAGAAEPGQAMGAWLRDLGEAGDLKERALEASRVRLESALADLAAEGRSTLAALQRIEALIHGHAERAARAVAREAMPMGPFLEAFREVLDERPTLVQRELRRGLRWTSTQVADGARWISKRVQGKSAQPAESPAESAADLAGGGRAHNLGVVEGAELEARWSSFVEPLFRELRAYERELPPDASSQKAASLIAPMTAAGAAAAGLERTRETLRLDPDLMGEYRAACREIITKELDGSGSEWALQLAVDALHLLPIGVAGAMIVHTGGVGADLAMAGGGALSAAAAERLSRTLGTGVALAARPRGGGGRPPHVGAAALRWPRASAGSSSAPRRSPRRSKRPCSQGLARRPSRRSARGPSASWTPARSAELGFGGRSSERRSGSGTLGGALRAWALALSTL